MGLKKRNDIGLSRGGKNTKIHTLVDGLGMVEYLNRMHKLFPKA